MVYRKCLKVLKAGFVYEIGKSTTADIVISHQSISASHCTIQVYEEEVHNDDVDDSEPKSGPRPETSVKLRLAITDSSSSGTWLYTKNKTTIDRLLGFGTSAHELDYAPIRLPRDEQIEFHLDDLIFLLPREHPDVSHYCYKLRQGKYPGEVAFCQVKPEVAREIRSEYGPAPEEYFVEFFQSKRARLDEGADAESAAVSSFAEVVALDDQPSKELSSTAAELVTHVEEWDSKDEDEDIVDMEQCVYEDKRSDEQVNNQLMLAMMDHFIAYTVCTVGNFCVPI